VSYALVLCRGQIPTPPCWQSRNAPLPFLKARPGWPTRSGRPNPPVTPDRCFLTRPGTQQPTRSSRRESLARRVRDRQ